MLLIESDYVMLALFYELGRNWMYGKFIENDGKNSFNLETESKSVD